MVLEEITTARAAGATGQILVRGDSAYGNSAVVAACVKAKARFSVVPTKERAPRASGFSLSISRGVLRSARGVGKLVHGHLLAPEPVRRSRPPRRIERHRTVGTQCMHLTRLRFLALATGISIAPSRDSTMWQSRRWKLVPLLKIHTVRFAASGSWE